VFFRLAGNTENTNPIESSAAFGVVFTGVGSRKDDQLGLAIGYLKSNTDVITTPEDTEWSLEFYYKFMLADGKFQITPNLIYVADPGGGGLAWEDDTLFILGVRFYVPF
jgi:carbohydrate-selective porin OprB